MPREIRLTNTMSGVKEKLETREPGKLSFYSCGPTVYGLIHIGNLRAALVSDMLFRYFQRAGYEVDYVRNYTDVDDKIIHRAREEGMDPARLAEKYITEVEKDYAVAGMREPTRKTTVTTHIPDIVTMIEKILDNGHAYVVDGEVFFSIDSFPSYGRLSKKPLDDLVAGARVDVNERKRNPLDFSLWKPAKPGEPYWESPWGKGRPGWHIECSAMSSKWLGERIDVHHGGEDLTFPHHENEIAQSEAASGKAPFVRVWLHHAFLNFSKEKMSKSLGNIITARDFLSRYGGEVTRAFMLSVHYRSPIEFGDEAIEQALTALHRIYEAKVAAHQIASGGGRAMPDPRAEELWGSFVASCEKARREIDEAFANDLNVSGALGALFTLIREFNRVRGEPRAEATPAAILGSTELVRVIEEDIGGILGFGRREPKTMLEEISRLRSERDGGGARPSKEEVEKWLVARAEARAAREFAKADQIRARLESSGVRIKDRPGGGTDWEYS